jgi:predicted HTH domain antitoxin
MITIDNKDLELTEEQEKDIRLEIAIRLYQKADYSYFM